MSTAARPAAAAAMLRSNNAWVLGYHPETAQCPYWCVHCQCDDCDDEYGWCTKAAHWKAEQLASVPLDQWCREFESATLRAFQGMRLSKFQLLALMGLVRDFCNRVQHDTHTNNFSKNADDDDDDDALVQCKNTARNNQCLVERMRSALPAAARRRPEFQHWARMTLSVWTTQKCTHTRYV